MGCVLKLGHNLKKLKSSKKKDLQVTTQTNVSSEKLLTKHLYKPQICHQKPSKKFFFSSPFTTQPFNEKISSNARQTTTTKTFSRSSKRKKKTGVIKTNTVVNATGVWGKDLLKPHGVHLPLVPMKHAYVISETIKEVQGMPNVRDHDYSTYFRIQGRLSRYGTQK